jgi:hypothetical protein
MATPETKDEPVEERIGNRIGNMFCLALVAYFVWAYASTIAAQIGLFR